MPIKAIDTESVRKITSAQVVTDLNSAVKEVVENALDANARSIEIKIFDYGKDRVEVTDDGDGIPKTEFEHVAKKHMTSKLEEFEDLTKIYSYGFRGEALSSICEMAELEITTCNSTAEPATRLEFNRDGSIKTQKPTAGKRGTSVTIKNIFHSAIVRRKEFEKNAKTQHQNLIRLMETYAVMRNDVRFSIIHITGSKNRNVQLITDGSGSMLKTVGKVYGNELKGQLMDMDFSFDVNYSRRNFLNDDDLPAYTVRVTGLVSKPIFGMGRNSNDKQMLFINKRPFVLRKLQKVFQDVYTTYVHIQKPVFVANFEIPPNAYDVNVSPDKRTILLHNETELLNSVREMLVELFDSSGQSVPRNQVTATQVAQPISSQSYWQVDDVPATQHEEEQEQEDEDERQEEQEQDDMPVENNMEVVDEEEEEEVQVTEYTQIEQAGLFVQDTRDEDASMTYVDETESLVIHEMTNTVDEEEPAEVEVQDMVDDEAEESDEEREEEEDDEHQQHEEAPEDEEMSQYAYVDTTESQDPEPEAQEQDAEEHDKTEDADDSLSYAHDDSVNSVSDTSISMSAPITSRRRVSRASLSQFSANSPSGPPSATQSSSKPTNKGPTSSPLASRSRSRKRTYAHLPEFGTFGMTVTCSSSNIAEGKSNALRKLSTALSGSKSGVIKAYTGDDHTAAEAESKLNLIISKKDFLEFDVVGQFNEAFIIVSNKKNLFIVDQHASDEKFNFERLQRDTKIKPQPVVNAMTVELTPLEEVIVSNHIDLLGKNGFIVEMKNDNEPGQKCLIKAFPQTGNIVFGIADFRELVVLFEENPGDTSVRPKKVRDIFASRACRGSVMVGTALKDKDMDKIVRNLATLDKPWNCPHGRPTMRHLMDLDNWPVFSEDYEC